MVVALLLSSASMLAVPPLGGASASATGNVLVVVAHPDDEALSAAGVIALAQSAGRQVYVAVVTNGDSRAGSGGATYCGTTSAQRSAMAQFGLTRDAETISAMGLLGLTWSANASTSDIFFLGYPDSGLVDVANSGTAWQGDATGLHRTYAEDGDGSAATCNGDLRYLLSGRHSALSASEMAADFESLLTLTNPVDIYTHAPFDGHADHAEVYQQVVAAAQRKGMTPLIHAALVHPEGTEDCDALSAYQWPNPATVNNDPFARFTPHLDVTAPPVPTCSKSPTSTSWGAAGAPNELVEVPAAMQATTEAANLKWQVISKYVSQIDCRPGGTYAASCGYMRAFVKRREFFWTTQLSPPTPPPPGSNKFGITTVGPLVDHATADFKFGAVHTLTQGATLLEFKFYARGGSASQKFVPAVYSVDANGVPAALVAQGAEVTVAANSVAAWRAAALGSVSVPAGQYMLALLAGPSTGAATLYYSAAAGGGFYNSNPYPTPSATWGTVIQQGSQHSFYVDYLPPTPDTTNPVASITSPANGAIVSGTSTVTATASDNVGVTKVELLVDGAVVGTDTATPYSFDWNTTAVANGTRILAARAFDAAGNTGLSQSVNVTVSNVPLPVDTVSPTASIVAPADGATVSGTTTVSANATDNVGVAKVEFLVDGAVAGTDTASPYSLTWDTTTVANGARTVVAKAYDAAGNSGSSAARTFTVQNSSARTFGDTTIGTLTDQPGAGYRFGSPFTLYEAGQLVTFRFYARGGSANQRFVPALYAVDASGAPAGLVAQAAEVTVAAGSAAGWRSSALPATTIQSGRYVLALLAGPSSGKSTLYFTSEPAAGMYQANAYPTPAPTWGPVKSINARYSFNVEYLPAAPDTQSPAAAITAPAAGATVSGTTTVAATVTDDRGVTRAELLVDGTLVETDTSTPFAFAWNTTGVANGGHTLVVKGYDVAGNTGSSAAVDVVVNNVVLRTFGASNPGTQPDPPPSGYRFGSIFSLTESAVLSEFRFYVRGGSANQNFIPIIYNVDGNGVPTNLVAQGAEVSVAAGAGAAWRTAALPASSLPAGNYLLAVLAGPSSGGATLFFEAETGAGRWAANTYPTPAPTWGPVNTSNARYSFAVAYQPPVPDTQAPSGSITTPSGGATVSGVTDVNATATDNVGVAKVDFLVDDVVASTDTSAPYSYSWDTRGSANGSHTLLARISDPAGNTGTSAPVQVTVQNAPQPPDTTSPTVTLTAPANSSTVVGTTTMSATASDDRAVARVEFHVDGSMVGSDSTSPYSYSWDSTTVANGAHALVAKAYDAAGNVGTSATVNVTVNNVAARSFGGTVAGAQTDQPGAGYKFGTVYTLFERAVLTNFRFYARGGSADQAYVPAIYNVDASGVPTTLVATGAQVSVPAGSAPAWQTAALPASTIEPGRYVLALLSGPASGGSVLYFTSETDGGMYNVNSFPTPSATWGTVNWINARYSFYVEYTPAAPDTESPTVSITAPASGATVSGITTVTATASDNSAVTKVEFLVDGVLASTDTSSPYAFTWDTATVPNGTRTLTAKAYDISGNVGTSQRNVNVSNVPDTQSPTVAITSPANGATVSNVTTITATAADNVRVVRVEFLVDGVVKSTVLDSPYSYAWDTSTATTGQHNLVARAYDAPGNVGTSSTVTVNNVTAGPAVSDDFSGTLNPSRWTFVNPLGDSSVSVNGTQAEISVAAGPAHYVWTGGAQAPRLMQTVANADFQVEAKFQSTFTAATQLQGIMIEQDANNFVRFDISRVDHSKLELAGATVAGTSGTGWFVRDVRGGADIYMRVKRVGNSWTLSYSYDGLAWTNSGTFTRALTVNRVGPFAGNSGAAGSAPPFTAKVDYFVNRASPPATDDGAPFAPAPSPPLIDVWYGDTQTFGARGRPQEWVNVLGRVSDADGITSLSYTLNGGAEQPLSMGENTVRLVSPGDFNVEMAFNSLNDGANTVRIKAVDAVGATTFRTVTVNHVTGVTAPPNYSVDFAGAASINSVAQITDGRWQLLPDGTVRTTEIGYDRLIALGDMTAWTNYEVSAELTIWEMPASGASVGLVAGWTGHTTDQYGVPAPDQPRIGHPFPVFAAYLLSPGQQPRLTIGANTATHQEQELIGDFSGRQLTLGVPYMFKLRTETNAAGGSHFSFKVWRVGTPEPAGWDLQVDGDRSQGAVLLGAHGGDVSFARVTVTGL